MSDDGLGLSNEKDKAKEVHKELKNHRQNGVEVENVRKRTLF